MSKKKKVVDRAARTLMTVIAGFINALGVGLLLVPYNFIDGGMSGVSFLISEATGLPMGLFIIALNIPFFAVGIKKLGREFILSSLVGIMSYGLFLFLFGCFPELVFLKTTQTILPAIFGGLLSGIGSGLTIRMGGSLDGIEVAAILLNKKLGVSVGKIVMVFNVVIMTVAGFVFSWENALFSIIAYAVGINAIDFVVSGVDKLKNVFIITEKGAEVAKAINDRFGQGVTMMDSRGFYSNSHKSFIYFVCSRFEMPIMKELIDETDPDAVVSVSDTLEVMGKNVRNRRNPLRLRKPEPVADEAISAIIEGIERADGANDIDKGGEIYDNIAEAAVITAADTEKE